MSIQPEIVVLIIHVLLCAVYFVFIFLGRSHLRKEYLIPILFLPVFGVLMALGIEWFNVTEKQGKKWAELAPPEMEEDILWKTLKNKREDPDLVPLEEALLIDNLKTRRKIMLQTLYDNPGKYLNVIMLAKNNDDIETAHYATATITHTQRQYQLAMQKYAMAVQNSPQDLEVLERYIDILGRYIDSGLLEEYLLRYQCQLYAKALDQKLSMIGPDKDTLIKKLENSLRMKDYVSTYEAADQLKKNWPSDEEVWLEYLRACVETMDRRRLEETLSEIQSVNIRWTRQSREQIDFWMKGVNS